jgi:hypothetical protein
MKELVVSNMLLVSGVDLFALHWNGMECTHAGHG